MNTEFSLRICPSGIGIYRDNKRFATVGVTVKTEEREAHLADTKAVGVNRFMLSDGDVRAELRFISGSSLVCFAEVKSEKTPLSAEATFGIGFSFENGSAKATTTHMKGERFWQSPSWTTADSMTERTQGVLIKDAGVYCLLPITSSCFTAYMEGSSAAYETNESGLHEVGGAVFSLSFSEYASAAVNAAFAGAKEAGAIDVPLRGERKYPEIFDYFGWCTWNAFYGNVSEEKIICKLDEFKAKGIIPGWVLIDDGWSEVKDQKLLSFGADKEKFPNGLAETVKKIKSYGVKYVGVWHAACGYWHGVHPESELAVKYSSCLVRADEDMLLPAPYETKYFSFISAWHSELKKAGVDFVKIDNQSDYAVRVRGIASGNKAAEAEHAAVDRSVEINFGGALINCMGMNMGDAFTRPTSAVNRNSYDFTPAGPFTFENHLVQNTFNALYNGALYYPDFDMFWSVHEDARRAALLRAISGGPVYTSDELDKSDPGIIGKLTDGDAKIVRPDGAAIPTEDEIFLSPEALGEPFKAVNTKDGDIYVAVFGLGHGDFGGFTLADVRASGKYEFTEYFTEKRFTVADGEKVTYTLKDGEYALYIGRPVRQ